MQFSQSVHTILKLLDYHNCCHDHGLLIFVNMSIFLILRILVVFAFLQSIIIVIHLFRTKGKSFSRLILAFLFLSFTLFLSGYLFLFFKGHFLIMPAYLANLFVFISAPILYFYMLSVIGDKKKIQRTDTLHFLPFTIIFGIMLSYLLISPRELIVFTNFGNILISVLYVQCFVYLALIAIKLKAQNIHLFSSRLSVLDDRKKWTLIFVRAYAVIILLLLTVFITRNILKLEICIVFMGIFFVASFLMINSIILIGLSKPALFESRKKYLSSTLNDSDKDIYLTRLDHALYKDQVFLDPLISLDKLSRQILVPKNCLSQIINETYHLNFNELINKHRIERAVELLDSSNGEAVIIEIAYQVGYNSKSTFNKAFKKFTGSTPSDYISKIKVLS